MFTGKRVPVIAVIGASVADEALCEIAQAVGEAISDRGWHLVCGGGGGVMEAACRGFRYARNELNVTRTLAIGVLPTDSTDFANEYVDLAMPTGFGWARNSIIVRMADGVIAVGGCSGTLSEIALAWQMGRPLVSMADSGGWSGRLAGQSLDDRRPDVVFGATSPAQALAYIAEQIEGGSVDES